MEKINTKVFLTVAETGSFNVAARELGYSQAGISYVISAMEDELGLRLFSREYGGVRLTADGKSLLPYFRQLANSERLLETHVNDLKGLECGSLRVLVFDSVSIHWIPNILRAYKHDFPGIDVEFITVEDSRRAEEMVYRQEVDCGFFLHSPIKLDLYAVPLMEESMKVIVAPDDPIAKKPFFPIAELGDHPYISIAFEDVTGIANIFLSRGITPKIAYRIDNDYAAMAMAANGLGFCIFPELLLQDTPYDVHVMDFDEPVSRIVSVATRSLKTCSLAAKKFIEYTEDWVRRTREKKA